MQASSNAESMIRQIALRGPLLIRPGPRRSPRQAHWTLAEKLDVDPHTLLHRSESAATALPAHCGGAGRRYRVLGMGRDAARSCLKEQ